MVEIPYYRKSKNKTQKQIVLDTGYKVSHELKKKQKKRFLGFVFPEGEFREFKGEILVFEGKNLE